MKDRFEREMEAALYKDAEKIDALQEGRLTVEDQAIYDRAFGTPGPAREAAAIAASEAFAAMIVESGDGRSLPPNWAIRLADAVLAAVPAAPDSRPSEATPTTTQSDAEFWLAEIAESGWGDAVGAIRDELAALRAELAALRAAPLAAPREPNELREAIKSAIVAAAFEKVQCIDGKGIMAADWLDSAADRILALRAVPSVPAPRTQQCPQCGGQGKWMEVAGEVSREMALDAGEPAMQGQLIEQEMTCNFCGGGGVVEVEPGSVPAPPSEANWKEEAWPVVRDILIRHRDEANPGAITYKKLDRLLDDYRDAFGSAAPPSEEPTP